MPQKKNPDACELTRGRTGRLAGNLVTLLTTLKGLPLTYNRDLQEDKQPLFDSIDTTSAALEISAEMIAGMQVNEVTAREACSDAMLFATDIADYLVKKGVPFRDAHEVVGKLTAYSLEQNTAFPKIKLESYQGFSEQFDASVFDLFEIDSALSARSATGAPSPENVAARLTYWEEKLGKE